MKERVIRTIFDEEMEWKSCQIFVNGVDKNPYLETLYNRDMVTLYEDIIMVGTTNSILLIDPKDICMINVYKNTVEELTQQIMSPIDEEDE